MSYKVEDISLDDLEKSDWISVRAINICKNNRLTGLNDIITFYRKHGSFKNLQSCGEKTEKELSEICKKFSNHSLDVIIQEIKERDEIKKLVTQLTNEEIEATNKHIEYLIFKLSVRSRNGLQSLFNGTPQAIELIDKIYSSTFSFHTIRNIGEKTATELDGFTESLLLFLKKFQLQDSSTNATENVRPTIITDLDESLAKIINDFNPFKRAALNRHIEYLISNLKIRARNGITQFFGETFTAREIIETIYSYSFDFQDIKNIGSKTVSELNNFKADISSFIETLRFIEDDHLSREYAKLIVKTTFSNLPINFNEQFENVFDNTGKIRLFKLIHFLIENGHILKQKEKQLFYFLYTENCNKSLEQIAIELDLGKERLRQIKVNFESETQDYFRFILSFNLQDLVSYSIPSDNVHFKIIDKDFSQKINVAEDVKFNVLFYSIIFGVFLSNSHSVLGDDENISGKGNYSNTIRYKNCYLIETNIFTSFNFEAFVNDININLSNRITETYALHFEGYLLQFAIPEGKQYLSSIKEICEAIIYNEFDLVVNNDGYIVFERNVRKTLPEYTYEILEDLGEMTKVEDIVKAINKKYPELDTNEQSIRATLQREKDLYIYIGRTSTYGLKKWELENKTLKGGTIRDIAEEYLEKYDKPQHTYDIVNYVKQYRNTSGTSIFRNIQAEDKNRFVFFEGGYIGLKSKNYAPSDTVFKRVAGTNFRTEVLKKFNGWDYDRVVEHYVNTHNYTPVQVISLFETKIQTGEIIRNDNNTITI
ncbi:MAG: hypothetical protein JST21_08160 [Bacteroidetes bacterium]|nr:hypothetical protein [Bacteroidota bacterium]MBS1746128.1 hypothetical protein [Bacteroidota bacterium]